MRTIREVLLKFPSCSLSWKKSRGMGIRTLGVFLNRDIFKGIILNTWINVGITLQSW